MEVFHDEMFVIPNEVNIENSVYSPIHATNIEHGSNQEVNDWTRDTMGLNRTLCYDDDVMLEEHVYAENIVEPLGSETLGFSPSTFVNDVSSNIQYIYTCDVDTDLEPVQLFCEEHDLGKIELYVDTNDLIHENKF